MLLLRVQQSRYMMRARCSVARRQRAWHNHQAKLRHAPQVGCQECLTAAAASARRLEEVADVLHRNTGCAMTRQSQTHLIRKCHAVGAVGQNAGPYHSSATGIAMRFSAASSLSKVYRHVAGRESMSKACKSFEVAASNQIQYFSSRPLLLARRSSSGIQHRGTKMSRLSCQWQRRRCCTRIPDLNLPTSMCNCGESASIALCKPSRDTSASLHSLSCTARAQQRRGKAAASMLLRMW